MLNVVIVVFVLFALLFSICTGQTAEVSESALNSAQRAVELVIQLVGTMALWGGLMEIANKSGLTLKVNKVVGFILIPFFRSINSNGKAMQAISMNVTANLLGLGNAATPLGIKAMKELVKEENAQHTTRNIAMLVLLNTSSIQLLPITIATIRLKYNSQSAWDCTLPVMMNSLISLAFGCMAVYILFGSNKKHLKRNKL